MIFMTDCQTNASTYCLLKISHYDDPRKDKKKIIFVDPGVEDLKKYTDYPYIDKLHYLAQGHLKSNEYLGIDYPSDMRKEMESEFILRSIENNWKYKDNPQYICGVQYKWCDYADFVFRMKELEPIYVGKKKIVALGNLCRLLVDRKHMNHESAEYKYFKKVVEYIIQNKEKFYWIHIYGMSLYAIKSFMPLLEFACPNIIFSVDSTKWTRVCNKKLHAKYVKPKNQSQLFESNHTKGAGCTKETRDEFFLEYISEIRKKGIKVEY